MHWKMEVSNLKHFCTFPSPDFMPILLCGVMTSDPDKSLPTVPTNKSRLDPDDPDPDDPDNPGNSADRNIVLPSPPCPYVLIPVMEIKAEQCTMDGTFMETTL